MLDRRRVIPPIAHRGAGITAPRLTRAAVTDETLAHAIRARLLPAWSLAHVNSQPFLCQPLISADLLGCTSSAPTSQASPRWGSCGLGETWVLCACCVRGRERESSPGESHAERLVMPSGRLMAFVVAAQERPGVRAARHNQRPRGTPPALTPCGAVLVRPRSPSRVRLRCKQGMGPRNFLACGGLPTR